MIGYSIDVRASISTRRTGLRRRCQRMSAARTYFKMRPNLTLSVPCRNAGTHDRELWRAATLIRLHVIFRAVTRARPSGRESERGFQISLIILGAWLSRMLA